MPFGLYVHFPFCKNRCSYCDFYKELYDPVSERNFFHALKLETELAADALASYYDKAVDTIFIGGGTPSLASHDLFADWLDCLGQSFSLADDLEFSVECNPESASLETLEFFKEIGVTRPTFGIQSFNAKALKLLGRDHNPRDSQKAVYQTNALGISTFGVDLLYGLPRQTGKMLTADLDELIDLDPPHISFYQLTVEEGTQLAAATETGSIKLPDDDHVTALYRGGYQEMIDGGYERYEVCSFAKPGHECRHNINYWEGGDYLGLGPSAHSFIDSVRFANCADINEYVESLSKKKLPRIIDRSGKTQRMMETVMLGLRTARGIDRAGFADRFGESIEQIFNKKQYDLLVESGHLIPDRGRLRLSEEAFILADEIARRLLQ